MGPISILKNIFSTPPFYVRPNQTPYLFFWVSISHFHFLYLNPPTSSTFIYIKSKIGFLQNLNPCKSLIVDIYGRNINRNRIIVRKTIMSETGPSSFTQPRLVTKKVLAKHQSEGDGAVVRRCIGRNELRSLDPFIMMDDFTVTPPAGFPDHPHRGFETVTYMTQGGITHQDFAGHKGTIHTGDVQWMTAGRGIIHSEMPDGEGDHKGLQLWINLSSQDKMIEPRYQELLKEDIPSAEGDGAEVRVIAGQSMGVRSPVFTRTPAMYLDFSLRPGSQVHQNIPESWNAFAYVMEGEGVFGKENKSPISAHHVVVLGPGDGVSVWNKSSKPLRFVLIAGQPLNEPIAQYGPFVMNTQAQIDQTIEDYHYCKNGFENAKNWKSH